MKKMNNINYQEILNSLCEFKENILRMEFFYKFVTCFRLVRADNCHIVSFRYHN